MPKLKPESAASVSPQANESVTACVIAPQNQPKLMATVDLLTNPLTPTDFLGLRP